MAVSGLKTRQPTGRHLTERVRERHRQSAAVAPDLDRVAERDAGRLEIGPGDVERRVAEMVDRADLRVHVVVVDDRVVDLEDDQPRRVEPGEVAPQDTQAAVLHPP